MKPNICRIQKLLIIITITGIFLSTPKQTFSQQWHSVKNGKKFGISGMALIEQGDEFFSFLVNHDNKKESENRLAIITIGGRSNLQYFALKWPDDIGLPIDLEALTTIPGETESSFMALASEGKVFYIKLNIPDRSISILKVFSLPDVLEGSNFEGFVLQEVDGKLLAVWADRGEDEQPAVVYWGLFDLATYKISQVNSMHSKVPWPKKSSVRHVSDLKIDSNGNLFISSASNAGDNGPFQSAIYLVGSFIVRDGQITFRKNAKPVRIAQFENHKVEAFDLMLGESSGMIFASDDENMGAAIYLDLGAISVSVN